MEHQMMGGAEEEDQEAEEVPTRDKKVRLEVVSPRGVQELQPVVEEVTVTKVPTRDKKVRLEVVSHRGVQELQPVVEEVTVAKVPTRDKKVRLEVVSHRGIEELPVVEGVTVAKVPTRDKKVHLEVVSHHGVQEQPVVEGVTVAKVTGGKGLVRDLGDQEGVRKAGAQGTEGTEEAGEAGGRDSLVVQEVEGIKVLRGHCLMIFQNGSLGTKGGDQEVQGKGQARGEGAVLAQEAKGEEHQGHTGGQEALVGDREM